MKKIKAQGAYKAAQERMEREKHFCSAVENLPSHHYNDQAGNFFDCRKCPCI